MREEIMVSIICNTYNHEKFVAQALDSFLSQKTNFEFEILIHDDASTDNTQSIIKQYEKKYPEIIKAIYQKENQFSKKKSITKEFQFPRVKGEFVALCEGDDFWTSFEKLQLQYDFLKSHEDYSLCAHSGYYIKENGDKINKLFRCFEENKIVSTDELIQSWLFPTASLMFRYSSVLKSNFPALEGSPCGDYPLIINLSLMGKVYYIDKLMCAYRTNSHSLTAEWNKNKNLYIEINNKFMKMLDEINEFTNGEYSLSIDIMKTKKAYQNILINGMFFKLFTKKYFSLFFHSIKDSTKTLLKFNIPFFKKIQNIYKFLNLNKGIR